MAAAEQFTYPAIVKPTDAAGSKGVSRVDRYDQLLAALKHAMRFSMGGHIIVEEFLEKTGCSSDTDCFLVDGKLVFVSFSAQRFDLSTENPYTPAGYSWPSTMGRENEAYLSSELQRLMTLLNMRTSIFNVESRLASNGKAYIMEVTPRGGGNRLAEMLQMATGAPLIENAVRACVGLPLKEIPPCDYKGNWVEVILHADKDGLFESLKIIPDYAYLVVKTDLWVKKGDKVRAFRGANDAIGTLVMNCDSEQQVENLLSNLKKVFEIE